MSDRHCIATNGILRGLYLSDADILSCCGSTCGTCSGGQPEYAWKYWTQKGVPTGARFGSKLGCSPYMFGPSTRSTATPTCSKQCVDSENYSSMRYYGKSYYRVSSDPAAMQAEIYNNGPIQGTFYVYSDFMSYKSGVYKHVSGSMQGGHAIKIIGWGTENGTPYWLCVNSWNKSW